MCVYVRSCCIHACTVGTWKSSLLSKGFPALNKTPNSNPSNVALTKVFYKTNKPFPLFMLGPVIGESQQHMSLHSTHTHTHAHAHTHTHTLTHMHTHTHTHSHICTHTHIHAHTHMLTYICVYTHISSICTHSCTLNPVLPPCSPSPSLQDGAVLSGVRADDSSKETGLPSQTGGAEADHCCEPKGHCV